MALIDTIDIMENCRRWMSYEPDNFVGKKPKTNSVYRLPAITEVIFNEEGKATVVRWADGEKTVVHCGEGETFDRYTGFMAAVCKRLFGGTTPAKKMMNAKDRKYQAKLRAEKEEKEKAKRIAEAKEAQDRAEKRRAKEVDELAKFFAYILEAKEKALDVMRGEVPFDEEGGDV